MGVAVLDGFLYAVGGQDGVQCLNHVERYKHFFLFGISICVTLHTSLMVLVQISLKRFVFMNQLFVM